MPYNPLGLHMDGRGRMVDKHGRVFEYDSERMKQARKPLEKGGRVWKSYHAHTPAK